MDSLPHARALQLPLEPELQREEMAPKPSLLPAFEPLSSSPFPRPTSSKRKFDEGKYKSSEIYGSPRDPALKQEYDEYLKQRLEELRKKYPK